jgi:heat shock protein HslJ
MRKVIVILLVSISVLSCKHSKHIKAPVTTSAGKIIVPKDYGADLEGNWNVEYVWGIDKTKLKPSTVVMDFKNKTFTANSGCNTVNGTFFFKDELLIIDKKMDITKLPCKGYNERAFINVLLKINRFNFAGDTLELSQDNIVLMLLKRSA